MRYSEFANNTERKQINHVQPKLRVSLRTDTTRAVPVEEPVNPLLDDLLTAIDGSASVSRIPRQYRR